MAFDAQFDYQSDLDFGIRPVFARPQEGIVIENFTYLSPFERRRAAFLVKPEGEVTQAAPILFVHWYEPEAPDSNNRQFLPEAITLAKQGAVCLLVETMWSDLDWFLKRTQADDIQNSIEQVVELRQAMDLLLSQPGIDAERFAYVGHDFGAMYGVLMGSIDPRPKAYVLMAGTPRWHEWFLYYPPMTEEARDAYIKEMQSFDPIEHIGNLAPAPVLLQFGDNDPHVPLARTEAFFGAASEPKEMKIYQAGHGLNDAARTDRLAWLSNTLDLA